MVLDRAVAGGGNAIYVGEVVAGGEGLTLGGGAAEGYRSCRYVVDVRDQGRSAGLRAGLDADIVVRSQAQNSFKGQVVRIELLSDSVTEERVALVTFSQIPKDISVGEVAEVTLALPPVENVLLIANASIQRQGDTMGVWRLMDSKLVFTKVRVGASSLDGDRVVLEGLQLNDQVVVHSQKTLTENSRVRVVEALR